MTAAKITLIFNISLIVIFILLLVGVALAGLRGYKRGVWKSTHNMLFIGTLFIVAFCTLTPLTHAMGELNIGGIVGKFTKVGSLYMSRNIDGEVMTYYIPISSVKETLTEFIKAFYTLYNVSSTASGASNFALAIIDSALKILIFVWEIILIMTVGNLLSLITWYALFQFLIPKAAQKMVKLKWVGMGETIVTFVVTTFLFFTPFTSLVNSLNQSYQRNRPNSENQIILDIGNFVDAYNDSIFAKILFNWTVDKNGMTIDTRLFDKLTTGISEDVSIGLVGEIANFTNLVVLAGSGFTSEGENRVSYDAMNLITQDIVDSTFDVLIKSELLTNFIPIAADIALNSDVLDGYVPNRLIDLSDVEWKNELGYVQEMIDCLFESGAIDHMIQTDENGKRTFRSFAGENLVTFIEDIIYDEHFDRILDVFKQVDNSKVISRSIPAVVKLALDSDQGGELKKYLPLSWEQLNEVKWGYECYVLFDFLHQTATLDHDFLRSIMAQAKVYEPAEGEELKSLPTLIAEHVDEFVELMVGKFDSAGNLINVDRTGRTIAFNNNVKVDNYCLFDMGVLEMILPSFLDNLFELEALQETIKDLSEEDIEPFHLAIRQLNQGRRVVNYKKEFKAVLNVVATLAKDEELLDSLISGKGLNGLITEEGNFFSIEQKHILVFQDAISKMEKSNLLYSGITPFLKSYLLKQETADFLDSFGVRNDVMASAIDHDRKKTNHTLFSDLVSVLDNWEDLEVLYTLSTVAGDTDAMMDKLKDHAVIESLVAVLNVIHDNKIINPIPEEGDTYEVNENLYGLLGFVFDMTAGFGLVVERKTLREVESPSHSWNDEFTAFGEILHYIAVRDILHASDKFADGLTRTAVVDLKDDGEGHVYLPGLFNLVDDSYIFSKTLGPFLDDSFGDSLSEFLIDKENNVSFSNVRDWSEEGTRIKNLLDSIYVLLPEDDEEAKTFLDNIDFTTLHKVVDLNDMLHELAHSGIFTYYDEHDTAHYQFGQWMYKKMEANMSTFTVDENEYDLLADPVPPDNATWGWNSNWGNRPGDAGETDPYFQEWQEKYNAEGTATSTHYIAYRDFVYLNGMDNTDPRLPTYWCDYDNFVSAQENFLAHHESDLTNPATYLDNEWGDYYASDMFITDYTPVFDTDEISRIVRYFTYSMRILGEKTDGTTMPFNEIPTPLLNNFLHSLNETCSMRISLYNFYDIAADKILTSYSAFSLDSAYNIYMVDADYPMFDYNNGRSARDVEIDKLINFYGVIDDAKSSGIINGAGDFNYQLMIETSFIDDMKDALVGFNDSFVYHRKGSAIVGSPTTFQDLINRMLKNSDIANIIYLGDNSPKDAIATEYANAQEKIELLVKDVFLDNNQIIANGGDIDVERNKQANEVTSLMDVIDDVYSMENSVGETVTQLSDVDMNNANNIEKIEALLNTLNQSDLLYDCVPNAIYNVFIKDAQFSISNDGVSVDFTRIDPFYHYFYIGNSERSTADYNERYTNSDISGIVSLIEDYQEFNNVLGSGNISDASVMNLLSSETGPLKPLLKDLHNSYIFHSPARNNTGSYYTDKFEDRGYTLFEETMSKICTYVNLDEFAFDASFDGDIAQVSAENKLRNNIKTVSESDDFGTGSNVYHTGVGGAWASEGGEIDAIVNIAHVASNISSGSLDITSFELQNLAPNDIKSLLTAINASDLISDALPKFIKDGFDSVGLADLTEYDGVDYAYYRLGQVVYGGEDAAAGEGTEIDEIYHVMLALRDGDHYMTDIDSMTMSEFLNQQGDENFDSLVRYIYQSHILDTSLDGVYEECNILSGHLTSAQGILIYNLMGEDLYAYVAKDADYTTTSSELDRIASMTKILHMKNYSQAGQDITYQIEAQGLRRLIGLSDGNIEASTFSSGDINAVKNHKESLLGIVEVSYNATEESDASNYKRSAIASEFVSGVLNTILENEYRRLDNPSNYPDYVYVPFAFGNDDASTLVLSDYDSISVVEKNGLEGILDSLDYVSHLATLSEADRQALINCFTKMGPDSEHNSELARILYLSQAHSKFKALEGHPNSYDEYFTAVDETSIDPSEDNNIYSLTFSFREYGQRIGDFTRP